MQDDIRVGAAVGSTQETERPSFVPMKVGAATVYIEQIGAAGEVTAGDIYTASVPDPRSVFEDAVNVLEQCVGVVGAKVHSLAASVLPEEIKMEFPLAFEVAGQAKIIPVLVQGSSKASAGLKVTATWHPKGGGEIASGADRLWDRSSTPSHSLRV